MGRTNACSGFLWTPLLQEQLIILISWYQLLLLTGKLKTSVHFYQQITFQKAFYGTNRSAQAGVSPRVALSIKGGKRRLLRKGVMWLQSNFLRRKPWYLQYFIFPKQNIYLGNMAVFLLSISHRTDNQILTFTNIRTKSMKKQRRSTAE